ncbi:hypothetical protein GQ55_7G187600 [Panicum hallii var. hallii]|uniref:Uncharacterized protein n=1 Tax=Panicum hallii var. hallii TaxID=1504633 RepID=A0A2T7CWI5_9POAL|nr:hypothetical protein GQ55_7G187600 [Panicum hallii var. hallii]
MAAAPPSPRPPRAHRDGGDAPISLFLETDLGTRLAILVAPDTTIGGLKSQVNAEHAAAFPDLGPVAVKSFQVRRRGVLYHLSDSMTVTSAFTKIKGINTSFRQEVLDTLHKESTQNPSTVGKKKKRRRNNRSCQLAPSVAADQETSEPSAMVKELSISTGDAYNVELTGRDETAVKASGLPLSSSGLNDGNQGGKHVPFMSDAQASTDLISEQGKFDHALKGCRSPSVRDAIYSAGEVVASEEKTSKGSIAPWDGDEKHEQIKQHDEGGHDEGVAEISNTVKDGKSTDALEKRRTNDNTSPLKKRKRENKASPVDLASMNTNEKEMHGYQENAARSGAVSTEREILHDPSTQQISNNVHQGHSNVIEHSNGDGKKKKTRRQHSESSKGVDPSQDLTKSSAFVTNESSMQVTDVAPLDTKQTTPCSIEGATVIDHKKLGENLDIAAKNVIDEVLADLRSKDSLSMDLDGDMLTGKTHLGGNNNALEHPEPTADEVGISTALPPKYSAAVHSDVPASTPRLKKSKREKLKVLSTMIDSSHHSSSVPEEDANKELNESESLRFSDKTSDPKDILTGDAVAQAGEKPKATKRRENKLSLKQVSADSGKTLDERVSQVDTLDLKGMNATRANLVQGGYVVESPLSTTGKVEQKGRRSSKTHTAKILGTNCSTPNAQKARKKSSNSKLQSSDSILEHGSSAELEHPRSEKGLVTPKSSVVAAEPNSDTVVHPASDAINFLDHFSSSKMNDPPISAEHKQNNEDETLREVKNKKKNKRKLSTGSMEPNDGSESLLRTDKTSLTDHFGNSKDVPSVAAENLTREDENVKNGKDKKRKTKVNTEMPVAEKENPNCDNQGYIGTQGSLLSAVQNGRMGQDNGKESSTKVTQNDSKVQYEPEDATLENKSEQSGVDGQNKLLTDKHHVHISKDVRKLTCQIKPHAKSKNDESIKRRVAPNPKPESNLVKDFSMSPQVSGDSTEAMPQNANRYRVAVRKVPSKRYEQTREKSKKENRKVGSAIFNDANSEGSDDEWDTKNDKAVMEASPDNSSTSADSGVSSAASDESDVPYDDDDGTVSLSQKRLKEGLHIGSILRGTSSYKKARKKQSELLDDDTVVPDSQPADGCWD